MSHINFNVFFDRFRTVCFVAALLFPQVSFASLSETENKALADAREQYDSLRQRIRLSSTRQLPRLYQAVNALADYPLFPYLYFEIVNRDLRYGNRNQIKRFLDDTQGLPIRKVLLKRWLKYLAKKNYQSFFLKTYEPGLGTELLCYKLHFDRRKNRVDSAWFNQVSVIWASASSQPKSCDPVFYYWRKNKGLTAELAKKRVMLSGIAGETKLNQYLHRFLKKDDAYLGRLWLGLQRRMARALKPSYFPFKQPEVEAKIAHWALKKLAWSHPDKLIAAYPHWVQSEKLSQQQLQDIIENLAINLTTDKSEKANVWLTKATAGAPSNMLWRWHMSYLTQQQNWSQVKILWYELPKRLQQQAEFRYWRARAEVALGNESIGNSLYAELSKERHYYGFLAAAILGKSISLDFGFQPISMELQKELGSVSGFARAKELVYHEQFTHARREWYELRKQLDVNQRQGLVKFAHQIGWHEQAIITALREGQTEELGIRFPLAHLALFERYSEQFDINPSLSLAIARRESSFMPDAISSAGARGLMQVLPSTGRYLVEKTDVLPITIRGRLARGNMGRHLFNPQSNIEIGIGYLKYLREKIGNNTVLISAAYNAGWRRVKRWLPENQAMPMDIWIDSMPFKETREYVKAILTYQAIYQVQTHKQADVFDKIKQMQTPVKQNIALVN